MAKIWSHKACFDHYGGLDALRRHTSSRTFCEAYNSFDDFRRVWIGYLMNKRLAYFDFVEWETAKVGKARKSRSEIV